MPAAGEVLLLDLWLQTKWNEVLPFHVAHLVHIDGVEHTCARVERLVLFLAPCHLAFHLSTLPDTTFFAHVRVFCAAE